MSNREYWKSLEEKGNQIGITKDEFNDSLPNILKESVAGLPSKRRDFLKMLGFSLSAATFAAGCQMPVKKSVPYIFKPEHIIPGKATFYASTFFQRGDFNSILVKTREGRPIKIEGNNMCPVTKGGTSARAQASLLSLYDEANRYKEAQSAGGAKSWEEIDREIKSKLASSNRIAIISSSIVSPSTKAVIDKFAGKYGNVTHVQYDAVSYSGALDANEENFGIRALPEYKFDKADVIVGIEADFLGTYGSPVEYAKRYIKKRKVSLDNRSMSRHIQIESTPTITGDSADLRIPLKPSEILRSLVYIYNKITQRERITSDDFQNENIDNVISELKAASGRSIVICSIPDKNVQVLVNAINQSLGNIGNIISFNRKNLLHKGSDKDLKAFMGNMASYDSVIVYECNPVYNVEGFADTFRNVKNRISLATAADETSSICNYVCPDHHYLESWNDAEPVSGVYTTTQPVITPIYHTRQAQESLMRWSEMDGSYYDLMKQNWSDNLLQNSKYSSIDQLWDIVVHDGVFTTKPGSVSPSSNFSGISSAGVSLLRKAAGAGEFQLHIYKKVAIGDGSTVDNPWCQETPDPVSKITWDNYILADPKWVSENGLQPDLNTKEFQNIIIKANDKEIELPVVPHPGHPRGSFSIAFGYGRTSSGKAGLNIGKSMTGLSSDNCYNLDITWSKGNGIKDLAATQTHFNITHQVLGGVKTRNVVKETSLKEYQAYEETEEMPYSPGNQDRKFVVEHLETIYPEHKYHHHHWAMGVDLNSCIGCSACVVACNVENNIPVVGKKEVKRTHEMHWMRIDKYYTGDDENPDVVFQPLMCQHCDNAPCENVCPVSATNHSNEGLNQMAYNRCFGTRYCANNCPYKVRRFNWYDYQGADSFFENTFFDNYNNSLLSNLEESEPLSRMVLNPDVTIRSRGVMEKCSFCVQRIQEGKLNAKNDERKLKDGEIKTACQTACPTDAIVFGDINDKESEVYKWANDSRSFRVIEEIHTLPSVYYLTKVRNKPEVGGEV